MKDSDRRLYRGVIFVTVFYGGFLPPMVITGERIEAKGLCILLCIIASLFPAFWLAGRVVAKK
jgi:hypothetical protein